MQLVSREILFDIMSKKKTVKLSESETLAFKEFKKKADEEYKKASERYARNQSDKNTYDEMAFFTQTMLKFMKENQSQIRYVGKGSSRYVYAMADGTALKIAKSKAGIAQNKQEAKICMNPLIKYQIFPDFYGADTEKWLTLNCELCAKAEEEDFTDILSTDIETVIDVIKYIIKTFNNIADVDMNNVKQHFSSCATLVNMMKNNNTKASEALWSLVKFYMKNGIDELVPDDLEVVENWGIAVRDNQKVLVVIDAGLSENIYQNHYAE